MSDWRDWIFGNLPPRPQQPTSRGALLGMGGYQNMPDMTAGIEDRRGDAPDPSNAPKPSLSPEAAANAQILSRYPPGSHVYNPDAYEWLQKNMPGDLPTTPIAGSPPTQAWTNNMDSYLQPAVIPSGPRSGSQFLDTGAEGMQPASQPSYQQMINYLQSWRGGAS